ncbi:MAG: site-specific integrase [Lachnospiraceae bacterium]|nr:site-specific integrase [Lachnospiraceae bacterium]
MAEKSGSAGQRNGEIMTPELIRDFIETLRKKNRGKNSLDSYQRILLSIYDWLPEDKTVDGTTGAKRRKWLLEEKGFSHRTVNTQMSALNSFFRYLGHREWQMDEFVRITGDVQPELSRTEYMRLLSAARQMGNEKTYLLIKTMGGAGVRVQEISQVTAEAVRQGSVRLDSHNGLRLRMMFIPKVLQKELMEYIEKEQIESGPVFLTRDRKPLSRTTINHYISAVSGEARVDPEKATPRCLWKMYQSVQDGIEENIHVLIRQAYEEMMEKEQMSIGWNV